MKIFFIRSMFLGVCLFVGVFCTLFSQAATLVVTPPSRALAAYASETKNAVNVRGLPSERDNESRIRCDVQGLVLLFR